MPVTNIIGVGYGQQDHEELGHVARFDFDLRNTLQASYDGQYGSGSALNFNDFQTIYVDNGANTSPVDILCDQTQYKFTVPAGYEGFFPLFLAPGTATLRAISAGAIVVPVVLISKPIPPACWPTVSSGGTSVVTFGAGSVPVSNTLSVGTARSTVANGFMNYFRLKNRGTASIWLGGPSVAVGNGYELSPGEEFTNGAGVRFNSNLSAIAGSDQRLDRIYW